MSDAKPEENLQWCMDGNTLSLLSAAASKLEDRLRLAAEGIARKRKTYVVLDGVKHVDIQSTHITEAASQLNAALDAVGIGVVIPAAV